MAKQTQEPHFKNPVLARCRCPSGVSDRLASVSFTQERRVLYVSCFETTGGRLLGEVIVTRYLNDLDFIRYASGWSVSNLMRLTQRHSLDLTFAERQYLENTEDYSHAPANALAAVRCPGCKLRRAWLKRTKGKGKGLYLSCPGCAGGKMLGETLVLNYMSTLHPGKDYVLIRRLTQERLHELMTFHRI